jgi:hypothetical protein
MHESLLRQLLYPFDIDRAPNAAGPPRGESVDVAIGIQALANTIDPPKAEGLIDGLRVADARLVRPLPIEPDPQLVGVVVVDDEPLAEVRGRFEENRVGNAPKALLLLDRLSHRWQRP